MVLPDQGQHPEEEGLQPALAGLQEAAQLQLVVIKTVDTAALAGLGVMLTAVQAEMRAHLIQTQLAEAVGEAGLEQAAAAVVQVGLFTAQPQQWQGLPEQAQMAALGRQAEQDKLSPAQQTSLPTLAGKFQS